MVNRILIVVLVLFSSVYATFDKDLSTYAGISLSFSVCLFLLWAYALFQFTRDFKEIEQRPIFYSTSLFPIYKYDPTINDVVQHYDPAIAWIAGLVMLIMWGFFTNAHITPFWAGAVLSIGIQLLLVLSIISMRSLTLSALRDAGEIIDERTAKAAWIETKKSYAY